MSSGDPRPSETVSFGFTEVPKDAKAGKVRAVFDSVADRYDVMNDAMSAGLHRLWKDAMAARVNPQPGEMIIDLAGGTGDIARRLAKRAAAVRARRGGAEAQILVTDINVAMLSAGLKRGDAGLTWLAADAGRLPFADGCADAVTISFGIRKVTDNNAVLAEARRVLKRGGRFYCLEFSRLAVAGLEPVYDAYSFTIIPQLGKLLAGDAASYRYLVESIRRFPDQERFAGMIRNAGFARVGYTNFAGGVCALHGGFAI